MKTIEELEADNKKLSEALVDMSQRHIKQYNTLSGITKQYEKALIDICEYKVKVRRPRLTGDVTSVSVADAKALKRIAKDGLKPKKKD